jgi:hypothetical protein
MPPNAQPQATAPEVAAAQQAQQAPRRPRRRCPRPSSSACVVLIQQVEQAYAQGQAAYRKGDLADAKIDFDRAVDLML